MGSVNGLGFYDGKIVERDKPIISLEDRAYQFGDGVYDAWMIINGQHFLRKEHLDRFERSAGMLGIEPCFTRAEVEKFSDEMLAKSGIQFGMMYFQWSRGWQMPRNHVVAPGVRPLLTGTITALAPKPASFYEKGCKVIFFPDERQLFCNIKTLNLLGSVMASNATAKVGGYECLMVRDYNGKKIVTESAHSNCYAVKDGVIYTAPLGNLILPGITRMVTLKLAQELGIKVVEEFQTPEFFLNADEVFVSAASGVVPVGQIDDHMVKTAPGPVFQKLYDAYNGLIKEACPPACAATK